MSNVWDAVHKVSKLLAPAESLRIANLAIAAANRHAAGVRRKLPWNGDTVRNTVHALALSPLSVETDALDVWDKLAVFAWEAAHLGATPEGMHTWAAAYQGASATQKSMGAYATHNAFATALVRSTFGPLKTTKVLRIVDPSVGAGNLLLAAIEQFGRDGTDAGIRKFVLALNGVELDPKARELCCLLLWLAGADAGVELQQIAENIRLANALTHDWWTESEPYDVVLMNPPWESLRHEVESDGQDERNATIARLSSAIPAARGLPPLYSAQGTGDRNLFKAFVELAPHLLVEGGRLGAVLPAAFASDAGMAPLRRRYIEQFEIARWTGFENRAGYFPIDSRYKFGLLAATRSSKGTTRLLVRSFAIEPEEVDAPHITLAREDVELVGGKYSVFPELTTIAELEILRKMLRNGTPLFKGGSMGHVSYSREVDLTVGKKKGIFKHFTEEPLISYGDGTFINHQGHRLAPLMEGRLVGAYDCFQKSLISGSGRTAVWEENLTKPLADCRPQYVAELADDTRARVALCDITAATNTRTLICTLVPMGWRCGNTAPVLEFEHLGLALAGLGVLNSMVFDWAVRRMVSGLHLNKFILEGMVWPDFNERSMKVVSHAAWSVCKAQPRSGIQDEHLRKFPVSPFGPVTGKPLPMIEALATIEREVALAFGLTRTDLLSVYSADKCDRRGFWRFFKSDDNAQRVVSKVLSEFEGRNQVLSF
jgi:hypothetical protein